MFEYQNKIIIFNLIQQQQINPKLFSFQQTND